MPPFPPNTSSYVPLRKIFPYIATKQLAKIKKLTMIQDNFLTYRPHSNVANCLTKVPCNKRRYFFLVRDPIQDATLHLRYVSLVSFSLQQSLSLYLQ